MNSECLLLTVDANPNFRVGIQKEMQLTFNVEEMETTAASFQPARQNESFMMHAFLPSRDSQEHLNTTGRPRAP